MPLTASANFVIPAFAAGIQPSPGARASCWMDPGHKAQGDKQ
jgi:hypothetical protein